MQINVFGSPVVLRDGRPAGGALAQRRRLALIAVLAVAAPPGRGALGRERLLRLLWPGEDEDRARAALSQALYAVRRELGREDAIVGSTDLRLAPELWRCDWWDFLQALADGADATASTLRTGPLLDGLDLPGLPAFEHWVEEERLDADRLWTTATERAATAATARGDHTAAADRWRALANADPLRPPVAIGLARALAAGGDREGALRQLRVHAALVRQELEQDPAPEIDALATEIEAMRFAPAPEPDVSIEREAHAAVAAAHEPAPGAVAPEHAAEDDRTTAALETPPTTSPAAAAPVPAPASAGSNAPSRSTGRSRRAPLALAVLALAVTAGVGVIAGRPDASPAAAVGDAARSTTPVLAIAPVTGDSLGDALAGILAAELARAEGVQVVSAARLREVAGRDAARPLAAAREAGASDLVEGTLLRSGDAWRLELQRTSVGTGRVIDAVRVEGRDVLALADSAAAALLATVGGSGDRAGSAIATRSVEAWRLFEAALRAGTEGARETAIAQLRGALRADSTFAIAALTLASHVGSASAEFLPLLRQAMRHRGTASRADAWRIEAAWLGAMFEPGAGALLDSIVAHDPGDLDARLAQAGPALVERADVASALRTLAAVRRTDSARMARPGRTRCYACEAAVHTMTVLEWADSLPAWERLARREVARTPTDGRAWSRLAIVLERDVARHAAMRAAIDSAVRYGEGGARGLLVQAATRRGDVAAVDAALAVSRTGGPDEPSAEAWSRALVLRNAGRTDEALAEARRYARLLPAQPTSEEEQRVARTLEATVLLAAGCGREAAAIWDSIARLPRPEWTAARRARQVVYYRTMAATARFEAGDTAGLAALADTLAVLGTQSGFARDRALHHHVRGLAALARGDRDAAIAELQRAIVFPTAGYTRTNWHLARTLEATGRVDEARRWYGTIARAARDGASLHTDPVAARAALARLTRR